MNKKHRETLRAIFERPTRSDVLWVEIERLLLALGAELREGNGSRVRVLLNGRIAVFHRPHPRPAASKAQVRDVREFLTNAGVRYDEV